MWEGLSQPRWSARNLLGAGLLLKFHKLTVATEPAPPTVSLFLGCWFLALGYTGDDGLLLAVVEGEV